MFFSQHFSFPCQYHSTIAPYSFIHLPPTLYNVFLPVLQFPLSVSFHHCSILIHLPPTLYNVFLPALQFSPVSIIPPLLHTQLFTYHRRHTISATDNPCQYDAHKQQKEHNLAPYSRQTKTTHCMYDSHAAFLSVPKLVPTAGQFCSQ